MSTPAPRRPTAARARGRAHPARTTVPERLSATLGLVHHMAHAPAPASGPAHLGCTPDTIEPTSHIQFRARVARAPQDHDGSAQAGEVLELAMRIIGYGGLLTELRRRPSDAEQAVHITAIMTVAQTVEMLFDQARETAAKEPGASDRIPLPGSHDLLTRWMAVEEEDVRQLGVPMLAAVLEQAGVPGDAASTADELWTACGY